MEINDYASKYDDWKEKYNWKECKTERQEYGKFLCSVLTDTDDSLVVNMDSRWGTGKTELLRRLYVELAIQQHAVVYIDAWESDFSNDALAVVCSELLTQLDHIFSDGNLKASEAMNKLKSSIKTCLVFGQGLAALMGEKDISLAMAGAKTSTEVFPDLKDYSISGTNTLLVEKIQKTQIERVHAMKEIKKQITFLAELMHEIYGLKKQIIILVDELDRCRPNYAIEMLEVIKHFFQTKDTIFLVATDTTALQHSVRAIYGADFDAESYLTRFFDRKITLPELPVLNYLKSKKLELERWESKGVIFTSFNSKLDAHLSFFSELFKFDMGLRDIDRAVYKFKASLNYIVKRYSGTLQVINAAVLMIGIVEEMKGSSGYTSRQSNREYPNQLAWSDNTIKRFTDFQLSTVCTNKVTKVQIGTFSQEMESIRIGHQQTKYVKPNEEYLMIQEKQSSDINEVLGMTFETTLASLVEYYKDKNKKYWLWDDYRKIISLSGHIQ